ncbi:MAG: hypothetical protein GKR94_14540 [Gammaproteobacteria bacterium]|nr:hypothetical protein [Gammaproteobacteria bacterium]
MLSQWPQATGEYVCRLRQVPTTGFEQLTVEVEWRGQPEGTGSATGAGSKDGAEKAVADKRQQQLGVRVEVKLVPPQSTAEATGVTARQKPVRLIDER